MTRLAVWLDMDHVGWLSHTASTNQFAFDYTPEWRQHPRCFPISPRLPLELDHAAAVSAGQHSAEVRQFFENLLPEGDALDHAALAHRTSKSNLVGLMIALGGETAGAVRVTVDARAQEVEPRLRLITPAELSTRIRARNDQAFSVWDGRVRLSIAGYQDKIAIYERDGEWFLVDGTTLASTWIVKPVPQRQQLGTLPFNEFFCMRLAQQAGLSVAAVRLVHVPEPVLLVRRFDRLETQGRVHRLHLIDGCQALGLPVGMKYERPYGDGVDVRQIRDGVSLPRLFSVLSLSPQRARDQLGLLRWLIFQVLIGNTDAHGKNVSFHLGADGLRLAPAYDLVCVPALQDPQISPTLAMGIGEAFTEAELTPFEWASFAHDCGLPASLVARQLSQLPAKVLRQLDSVSVQAAQAGVPEQVIERLRAVIEPVCRRQMTLAPQVAKVDASWL